MVRYVCMYCGAGGASGSNHHNSPPSYHCHNKACGKKDALFPAKVVEHLQRVEAERDALAAHVEQQTKLLKKALDRFDGIGGQLWDEIFNLLEEVPQTSLDRLKALAAADALEDMVDCVHPDNPGKSLRDEAARLRAQAERSR